MGEIQNMKRFLPIFFILILCLCCGVCGCGEQQIDRGKELQKAMDTCDTKWSQAFPEGTATFEQIADFIAGWGGNAGMKVTKKTEDYIVLTNAATRGQKKSPTVTTALSIDPSHLRDNVPLLSLGMTSLLGPAEHGRLRLIVMEGYEDDYPGAGDLPGKYMDCDHFIYLYRGGSNAVYTAGPMTAAGNMTCRASRKASSFDNAFRITVHIPETIDPYSFERASSLPNPINVIGDLLASAKSSGRLFEIASFTARDCGPYLPSEAKAVVVIDDNNVEAFQKRFDTSFEAFEKRFGDYETETDEEGNPLETFTYTMEPVDVPNKVLKPSVSDNIISLMYTLQTGIHLQDEETGSITAASYIRSISTKGDRLSLVMDLRSKNTSAMEEMSSNYLITSGLCDVKYQAEEPRRLWSCEEDSSLAAWFTATVNEDKNDTILMQSSECDTLYSRNDAVDMILYRYGKSDRDAALKNLLDYCSSLSSQD